MTLHKEYHKLENGQEIKFTISFNREQYNWATSQPKKIGYQVSAIPVKTTTYGNGIVMEESGAFTGFLDNLIECDRQSSKRLQTAINELQNRLPKYLQYFIDKTVTA